MKCDFYIKYKYKLINRELWLEVPHPKVGGSFGISLRIFFDVKVVVQIFFLFF